MHTFLIYFLKSTLYYNSSTYIAKTIIIRLITSHLYINVYNAHDEDDK